MSDFENLPVSIRLTPDGTTYQVGVEIHGAFQPFTFGGWPRPSFEAYLAEAIEAENKAQSTQTPTPAPEQ